MFSHLKPLNRAPRIVSDESTGGDNNFQSSSVGETFRDPFTVSPQQPSAAKRSTLTGKVLITRPGPNDVLCGRGSAVNSHIGNRRFRQFLDKYQEHYLDSTKSDKSYLALQLVLHIQTQTSPPGRFLMKLPASEIPAGFDESVDIWYEIDALKASKKVSQRLREGKKRMLSSEAIKSSETNQKEMECSSSLPAFAPMPAPSVCSSTSRLAQTFSDNVPLYNDEVSPVVCCDAAGQSSECLSGQYQTGPALVLDDDECEPLPLPTVVNDFLSSSKPSPVPFSSRNKEYLIPTAAELVGEVFDEDF